MKKTLALVLVLCMALLAVPSFALTLEAPESAGEIAAEVAADGTEAQLSAAYETADTVEKTSAYGELILFEGFEHAPVGALAMGTLAPEYYDPDYRGEYQLKSSTKTLGDLRLSTDGGTMNQQVIVDPTDTTGTNHVMQITKASQWDITNYPIPDQLLSKPGAYTLQVEVYYPSATCSGLTQI